MNARKTHLLNLKPSYFFYTVLFICLSYVIFEFFFISYSALAADEFVFARHIYEYTYNIPYRDFPPYKTVLGYYLFSIPMFFSHALLAPLYYIKDEIALINAICIAIASYWALRFFDKKAILFVLLIVLANQSFLIYSSDLRVDMLTSWFCLFAAIGALENRMRLAGVLMGTAFLISQKALWYLFAIDGALMICWLTLTSSNYNLRSLITFNIAAALPVIAYISFWSFVTSPSVLLHNLFYEAYIQAGIDWYMPIYLRCWDSILYHGPLLFLLWPLCFMSLFGKDTNTILAQRRIFIISFASIALLLLISYKQPFPYNSVFSIPAFFLLYADFISQILAQKNQASINNTMFTSRFFISIIAFYTLAIICFIYFFALPAIHHLIALLPALVCVFFFATQQQSKRHAITLAIILSIFTISGIAYPLYQSFILSYRLDGRYQQAMIQLTANLLDNEGDYIGGIPFLYQKDQPIAGVRNLIGPAIEYLYEPTDKIKTLLLPSLYLSPTTTHEVIEDFKRSPVKVIIYNYRMLSLPPQIRMYFDNNYEHFFGSIYLYAPVVFPEQLSFYLKFTGQYRVEMTGKSKIAIDGRRIHAGQIIDLEKGDHITDATRRYRLVLVPKLADTQLDPNYQNDNWVRMIKGIVV